MVNKKSRKGLGSKGLYVVKDFPEIAIEKVLERRRSKEILRNS